MTIRTLALASGTTTAEDHRLLVGSLLGGVDGDWPLDRRGGLFYSSGVASISGEGMTATVRPFTGVVSGGSSPLQGSYLVVSSEEVSITLDDGLGTGSRTDLIGVVVRDDVYDDSGRATAEVRIVRPGVDDSYLPLFEVTVPQGASEGTGGVPWGSAVQDRRIYTASAGGVITVPDMASRERLPMLQDGTLVHVLENGDIYLRSGGVWRPVVGAAADSVIEERLDRRYEPIGVPRMLAGSQMVDLKTSENDYVWDRIYSDFYYRGSARVAFPRGYFRSTPSILLTARTSGPGLVMEAAYTSASVDGFTINLARHSGTSTGVDWLAIERTT